MSAGRIRYMGFSTPSLMRGLGYVHYAGTLLTQAVSVVIVCGLGTHRGIIIRGRRHRAVSICGHDDGCLTSDYGRHFFSP
ncbi:MAG: hypothetical protein IJX11_01015 [Bacteroidales bacterium]|nr:hypothetical protein [Bacteroidales bacterium]